MTAIVLIAIVAGVAVAVLVLLGLRRYASGTAERRLVARVGAARTESLIEFETSKMPGITRTAAARRAWDRWEYDQTR